MSDDGFFKVLVWLCVGGCIAMLAATKGCSDAESATSVLRSQGYTRIETTGYSFGCGSDDQCTGFVAVSPSGQRVRGQVGCGWFMKGCTIRLESP